MSISINWRQVIQTIPQEPPFVTDSEHLRDVAPEVGVDPHSDPDPGVAADRRPAVDLAVGVGLHPALAGAVDVDLHPGPDPGVVAGRRPAVDLAVGVGLHPARIPDAAAADDEPLARTLAAAG